LREIDGLSKVLDLHLRCENLSFWHQSTINSIFILTKFAMKRLLSLAILLILGTSFVWADTWNVLSWESLSWQNLSWEFVSGNQNVWGIFDEIIRFECPQNKYELIWPSQVLLNEQASYNIKTAQDVVFLPYNKLEYKIYSGESLIQTFTGDSFGYLFKNMGNFLLKVEIQDPNGCNYFIDRDIKVYKDILLYVWYDNDFFNLWFENVFEKKNVLFKKIFLEKGLNVTDDNFFETLSQNIYYIRNSRNIIIQWDKINFILQNFTKIVKFYNFDFSKKQIYSVTDINENFLRRVLFRYMKSIWTKEISVLKQTDFLNFITQLSTDKPLSQNSYIKTFSASLQENNSYLFISSAVDYLIYNGIPNWIIWLILTLCAATLVVSIFRQVIGLPVFSVYNPILFAMSMSILWLKFTFILFLIGFVSTFLIWLINKKIYLLHSAKVSMLVIIYFVLVIAFLTLERYFNRNLIDYSIFSNNYILFPIIFIVITADKVFGENLNLLNKWFYISLIEFLVISFIVYLVLNWPWLNYLLLSYPETIIWIIILNMIAWRFTGLQLMEYIRFYPLIKDGEEEE